MIAALFALAAAMLVAGVTAVIEGFPYVRLESGMAMVYGGSVVASSGVLLGGLAVIAMWLRKVEKVLREGSPLGTGATVAPASDLGAAAALAAPAFVPPVIGAVSDRKRVEPAMDLPRELFPEPAPVEPELPMPGLEAPPSPEIKPEPIEPKAEETKPPETKPAALHDDLFVPGRIEPAPVEATPLRSSLDAAPEPPAEARPEERTVVGRYSSGGNTYMMFDNGSIEAETPNGRFTFASLDELKAFVDNGGEGSTRGAA